MTKTKVGLKNANWRRSEAKGQVKNLRGVPKEGFLVLF